MATEGVGVAVVLGLAAALGLSGLSCMNAQLADGGASKYGQACVAAVPSFLEGGEGEDDSATVYAVGAAMVMVSMATLVPSGAVAALGAWEGAAGRSPELPKLYMSHFLSAWGDRMWQIATPMLFMDIFKDTLLPTSLYTLVVYLVVVQFMPYVGTWIDLSPRLSVQQVACSVENACIILTTVVVCLGVALDPSEGVKPEHLREGRTVLWFSALIFLGCVGELLNGASTVSIEKDWVVVLANEADVPVGKMNTLMRRIDLCCKALSPAVFALLYEMFGQSVRRRIFYGAGVVGVWNLFSFPLELFLLRQVYRAFPALAAKVHEHDDGTKHAHDLGHLPHFHTVRATNPNEEPILSKQVILCPETAFRAEANRAYSGVLHAPLVLVGHSEAHGQHGHSHSHRHVYRVAGEERDDQHETIELHGLGGSHEEAGFRGIGDSHVAIQLEALGSEVAPEEHGSDIGREAHFVRHQHDGGSEHEAHVVRHQHDGGIEHEAHVVRHQHDGGIEHEHDAGSLQHYHVAQLESDGSRSLLADVIVAQPVPSAALTHSRQFAVLVGYREDVRRGSSVWGAFGQGLRVYRRETVFWASLAYTLIYMTVLDNGALMTSYLEWAQVSPVVFGVGRGVGAVFGLLGTFLFPFVTRLLGDSVAATGLLSLWLFWLTLTPVGVALVAWPSSLTADYAMVVCVALSRCWLWQFDLAITELCQRYVDEENRGLFGTVQTASYQFFYILIQAAGILSPRPQDFARLVHASLLIVLGAALIYTYWYRAVFGGRVPGVCSPRYETVAPA